MLLTSTKSYADLLKLQCKYQGLAAGQFSSLSGRQPCIIVIANSESDTVSGRSCYPCQQWKSRDQQNLR